LGQLGAISSNVGSSRTWIEGVINHDEEFLPLPDGIDKSTSASNNGTSSPLSSNSWGSTASNDLGVAAWGVDTANDNVWASAVSAGAGNSTSASSNHSSAPATSTRLVNVAPYGPPCYGTRMVGSVGLIKEVAGTLTLAGNNTYSGGTTITSGTIQGGQNALGLGTGEGGAVTVGSPLPVPYIPLCPGQTLVGRDYWGGTGATMNMGGLLQVGSVNTFTGGTTVCGGTLQVVNLTNLGSTSVGTICLGGGVLQLGTGGTVINAGTLTINQGLSPVYGNVLSSGSAAVSSTGLISGTPSGGGSINTNGGSLTLSSGRLGYDTLTNAGVINLATPTSSNGLILSGTSEPTTVWNHDAQFTTIVPSTLSAGAIKYEIDSLAAIPDGSSLTVGSDTGVFAVTASAAPAVVQNLAPVPEPGTLALLAIAAGAILALRLRALA